MPYKANILGWMPIPDLEAIEKISAKVPDNGVVVEVGSMFGKSSVCWAMSCLPTVKIYCIDGFMSPYIPNHIWTDEHCEQVNIPKSGVIYDMFNLFKENTKDFPNVTQIKAYAPRLMEYNGGEIDVFFLDANHKNPNDWDILCHFVPLIKAGGIICGHDYGPVYPDVISNVERLEKITGNKVVLSGVSVWSLAVSDKIHTLE